MSKKWSVPDQVPRRRVDRGIKKWHLNVGEKKGEGAFGVVSKGTLSRVIVPREYVDVAVKEQEVDSHEHEVSILRQLSHQNIVPLLGAYVENDRGYLVVPMYKSSLDKWIGPCYDILMDVNDGLEYLKEQKVVHRDIKAENICVRETAEGPEGVIIDFGVSINEGEQSNYEVVNGGFKKFVKEHNMSLNSDVHEYDLFCLMELAGKFGLAGKDKDLCEELKAALYETLVPSAVSLAGDIMENVVQLRL